MQTVTDAVNNLWKHKAVDKAFTAADVAYLYKKGDHELPSNYRPISLLNASYTIYANILHHRISMHIGSKIGELQFGFRKH